jgi:hypothetical protein
LSKMPRSQQQKDIAETKILSKSQLIERTVILQTENVVHPFCFLKIWHELCPTIKVGKRVYVRQTKCLTETWQKK